MDRINNNDIVRHFKGKLYQIIANDAYDSEDHDRRLVVYRSLETGIVWVRPYDMFMSEVDREKYPNISQKYRFEKV